VFGQAVTTNVKIKSNNSKGNIPIKLTTGIKPSAVKLWTPKAHHIVENVQRNIGKLSMVTCNEEDHIIFVSLQQDP
jgi:hypothetical protein